MKKFKKDKIGYFVCEECGKSCYKRVGLSSHIFKYHHISMKDYIDKWIKEKIDGICPICGNPSPFNIKFSNYNKCCSKECTKIYAAKRSKEEIFKKYGVKNISYLKIIKDKIGESNKNKSIEALKSRKKTNIRIFGVENPMQNKQIFIKNKISCMKIKNFRNIKYQGSYELDFLIQYYKFFPDLINPLPIKYEFINKNRYYYPDFYIPSLNLIVEIKNLYLSNNDKSIIMAKEKATINNGFNYIMIIDKNYEEFDNYLHKASAVCVAAHDQGFPHASKPTEFA
jgi:hypothetical protein